MTSQIFLPGVRSWCVLLALLTSVASSASPCLTITDVDDTATQTNTLSKSKMVVKGALKRKGFEGMDELYRELNRCGPLFAVTVSPHIVRHRVEEYFRRNGVAYKEIVNRTLHPRNIHYEEISAMRWIWNLISRFEIGPLMERKAGFKAIKVGAILNENSYPLNILIGDDIEGDILSFAVIREQFPDREFATYIHAVTLKSIRAVAGGEPIRPFFTAADIAYEEYKNGRMTDEGYFRVAHSVRKALRDNPTSVFPPYVRRSLIRNGLKAEYFPQPRFEGEMSIVDKNYLKLRNDLIRLLLPRSNSNCSSLVEQTFSARSGSRRVK